MSDLTAKLQQQQRHNKIHELFKNSSNYREKQQKYRKLVCESHFETIVDLVQVMISILKNSQSDPYSKLLVMRFVKQIFIYATYAFLILINSQLPSVIFEIALYKKSSTDEQRGQDLFLDHPGNVHEKEYLKVIGYSFQKIVLQTYSSLSQCIKSCPYSNTPQIPSKFNQHFQTITALNIKISKNFTYYRLKQIEKFKANYQANCMNDRELQKKIDQFYSYLFEKRLKNKELFEETKMMIVAIVKSGDQFCIPRIVGFTKSMIKSELRGENRDFDYVDFVNELFLSADFEMIKEIQRELLEPLLIAYQQRKLPYVHGYQLCSWGILVRNSKLEKYFHCFPQIAESLRSCSDQEIIQIQEKFAENLILHKKINDKKLQMINMENQNEKEILQILQPIKERSRSKDKVQLAQEQLQISIPSFAKLNGARSKMNYFVNSDSYHSTPKKSKMSFKESIKQESKDFSKPKQVIMNDILLLKTNKKSQPSNKYKNGSCPNFSERASSRCADQLCSQGNNFNNFEPKRQKTETNSECKMLILENKVKKAEIREKQLERMLQQKDRTLKMLLQNKQSKQNPKMKKISTIRFKNYQTRKDTNFTSFETYDKDLHIDSEESKIARKLFPFSYKLKKQILKRKILVMKNADIEIGLISLCTKSNLESTLYITPLTNLTNFNLQILCPQWLQIKEFENKIKSRALAEIQFTTKVVFSLNLQVDQEFYKQCPKLRISYIKEQTRENCSSAFQLAIFMTKFCEGIQQFSHSIGSPQQSMLINIDKKVWKNFDDFFKYFPLSVMLNDPKIYAAYFQFLETRFYLVVKMLGKNEAILKIISNNMKEANMNILLTAFCSLLGV